jgi:aminopeptidase N
MSQPKTIYLKNYKHSNFTISSIDLQFDLFEEHTTVTNTMQMIKTNSKATLLELNSIELELISIMVDGIETKEYNYENELLSINNLPDIFTLKIVNKIYPQKNTELEGLYKSGGIFCTQNEPEGFRRITPYLDRPDVMSIFTTTIVADKKSYPILLGNGNPQREAFKELNDGRHSVTWFDPHPKPAYLFALVAGDLGYISDAFTTASGTPVELNIYCDLGNESKCHHAMKSLKEAMVWDEEKYGREYDLDIFNIVAVESFNMGAMENKGLNIFNDQAVLADTDVATDANFMRIQSIVAHEYFHNWTGNRITCKNWFQLTLKEGLTVFRDQCFSADLNSAEVQRIDDVEALRNHQFVEDASPTSHPIQPKSYISMNNFYTSTVYEKGAEVIRMIHTLIGEEVYRKAMDLYFETFDGQAVTTHDFLWTMQEASGHDLTQFKRWYDQSGTPTINVKEQFKDDTFTVEIEQVIPQNTEGKEQEPYYFPLTIGLIDPSGKELLEKTLIIAKKRETFTFENLKEKPYLSVNRDFSAPVIIKKEKSDHLFALKHDCNSFARFDATQTFAIETLKAMMNGKALNPTFVESYGYLLELDLDLSYKALLLQLPNTATLIQGEESIDFDLIREAKERLTQTLAETHKEKLLELYHENHFPKAGTKAKEIAKRSVKNQCLMLLSTLETQEIVNLAQEQYINSFSMSDRMVALSIIENSEKYHSKKELQHFHERYKNDHIVMTKYLSILAFSQREGLLERIKELEKSELYDITVPNIVRALIGSFLGNNKFFHAKDGSGYLFLADKLIEIDSINAQMASRLAGAFKLFEKMNSHSKALMKVELERVVNTKGISSNLYEIVSKILKVEA